MAQLAAPELSTSRLSLRALHAADASRLACLANDVGVARMTAAVPHPYNIHMAQAFIGQATTRDPGREAVFAVDLAGEGFIGLVGFHRSRACAPELGYWLGRPYWGQGYMTEAVRAALDWAGTAWRKRFILSGHFADNPASGQVLIKSGFLYTGDVVSQFSVARGEKTPTRRMVWLA